MAIECVYCILTLGLRRKNSEFEKFVGASNDAPYLLTEWTNNYKNPNFYQWCIDYYGKAIGSISVLEINEELKSCDRILYRQKMVA